jgi:hypothetical protein
MEDFLDLKKFSGFGKPERQNRLVGLPAVGIEIVLGRKEQGEKKQSIEEKNIFSVQCFAGMIPE